MAAIAAVKEEVAELLVAVEGVSRMVSADLVDNGRWDYIEELARDAMSGE